MICPFPRVLANFVSVCLAAIYNFFEDRKKYSLEKKIFCFDSIFLILNLVFDSKIKTVAELMKKKLNAS